MRHNIGGGIPAGIRSVRESSSSRMAKYDKLGPALRELYDSAPLEFDVTDWLQAQELWGESRAVEFFTNEINKYFPEWRGGVRVRLK